MVNFNYLHFLILPYYSALLAASMCHRQKQIGICSRCFQEGEESLS